MTGAHKRGTLLRIAAEAEGDDLGLLAAALTQIAGYDLDDVAVCAKWVDVCEHESKSEGRSPAAVDVLIRAARILNVRGTS